jgi:hypothetical protein
MPSVLRRSISLRHLLTFGALQGFKPAAVFPAQRDVGEQIGPAPPGLFESAPPPPLANLLMIAGEQNFRHLPTSEL